MASDNPNRQKLTNANSNKDQLFVFPSKRLPYSIQFLFKDYEYSKFINSFSENSNLENIFGFNKIPDPVEIKNYTVIELPFPRALNDATGISSNAFERDFFYERLTSAVAQMGDVSEGINKLAGLTGDILSAVRNAGAGKDTIVSGLQNALSSAGGINTTEAFQAAQFLAKKYLPGDLAAQTAQAGGAIINPQTSLAFSGVNLKEYSFSWDLFPSSRADSEQLKQIIRVLKNKMLPKIDSGATEGLNISGFSRAYLKYPSVVIVNLIGVDETHFVRFKPAMLTSVTVDYGAGSEISMLRGGRPSGLTLRLDFTEFNIHSSEDYDDPNV
jgi:hypothetical protein